MGRTCHGGRLNSAPAPFLKTIGAWGTSGVREMWPSWRKETSKKLKVLKSDGPRGGNRI